MADRTPKRLEHVVLYGELMPIIGIRATSTGLMVSTEDSAGWRIERRVDGLWFDSEANAWRDVGHTDKWPEGDVVVPLDLTELVP